MTADLTMASKNNVLMEIVIGTYEKYLLGYNLEMNLDQFILKPSFTTEAHIQSIKCIASSNKLLASGSIDETIQLFNMKTRKEIGALQQHNGTITCLEFFDSYLFSSSEDKNICIWSTKNWQCEKTLRGHKDTINSFAIHPSGKMALSVGKDKTLRTWNLIKGRSAYVTNTKNVADIVHWTPDGSHFLVSSGNSIDVYSVEKATVVWTIDFNKKICDFTFIKDDIVAIGGESEFIQFYDLKSKLKCFEIKVNTNRIKALKCVSASEETFLVSASSDGCIKIWHLDLSETELKARKVAKVKTGSRPTCMAIILKSED
ncbi:p21-activated protein kinase-interacting protein 1-like [Trichonephila clavata]|uniref:p21-activated protein kinase-interacting protein 1-like n=1 Tax=Trichonephila clavata TaxID=2740835 RepID=A0A8X6H8C3_TRICU|nr:p21-activated protein kinase-interacting protein 1-like [Trichonephila clavata]